MKRNGEDMLRKTEEGAVSTGAEAGTATGGKAYDWCVCVHIAIGVEVFICPSGLVRESAGVAIAIVVGLDQGIEVAGDRVPGAEIERGGEEVMRGKGITLLAVLHDLTAVVYQV